MRTIFRLSLLALTTSATMALAVGTASANHLSTSSTEFYHTYSSLEFIPPVGETVRCGVTLSGSFHSRTSSKIREALSGSVTHVEISEDREVGRSCTGGHVTVFHETLPWHLRYVNFTGILPTITGVTTALVGARLRIANGSATCNLTTTAANPSKGITSVERNGAATGITAEGSIPTEGEFFCEFATGSFRGSGSIKAERAGATNITIRLI